MRRNVHHHVGVGIIQSKENKEEFLFGVYDQTYPKPTYRGRVNLLGGNHSLEDNSPLELFQREINEEFTASQIENKEFASESDILDIREAILNNVLPYKDFFIRIPSIDNKPARDLVYSVFTAQTPFYAFELVRKNLTHEKIIKNEGYAKIVTLDELTSGEVLSAAGTPLIMQDFTGEQIPNPEGVIIDYIGHPRNSMKDYLGDFNYALPLKLD